MPFDGFFISALARELNATLALARVESVYQPEKEELLFTLRQARASFRLLCSAHPDYARVHLTENAGVNPAQPPAFCMLLRKYLQGARLLAVTQPRWERILHFTFTPLERAANGENLRLVVEIMGRHSNLILLEEKTNLILDALKRIPRELNRYREILPGVPYLPPPTLGKHDPDRLPPATWEEIWASQPPQTPAVRVITDHCLGFSPFLAQNLLARAGLPPHASAEDVLSVFSSFLAAWEELLACRREGRFTPCLFHTERGLDFAALLPPHLPSASIQVLPTLSQAVERALSGRAEAARLEEQRRELRKHLQTLVERAARKATRQEEELAQAEDAEKIRLQGELLTANLHHLPPVPGQKEITVVNYYDPEQAPLTIPLDPRLTPAANAQAYFRLYSKRKKGQAQIAAQLEATRRELAYLEQVLLNLEQADTLAELAEIRAELAEEGYLAHKERVPARPGRPARKEKNPPPSQPLTLTLGPGLLVRVGKNNRQNDWLTLRWARKQDLWFHVKDLPGAHVILRAEDGQPFPPEAIVRAAGLAAYYSKARQSSNVPVDYTACKHVRKPPGAKPGMVIYDHQKTIYVTPSCGE